MISYEAAPGAKVFVKGSEVLKDGWAQVSVRRRSRRWRPRWSDAAADTTWRHELTGAMFPDAYKPFALPSTWALVSGSTPESWTWDRIFRRRGLVFVDGKPLEPVEQQRELTSAESAAVPRLPVPAQPPEWPAAASTRRADHAGDRRLARRAVLGGALGAGDPRAPSVGHARRPHDRSHDPRAGLRPRAERAGLHPHQGHHLPARRQRVSRSRSAAWSLPPAAITGSSKTTPSSGPTASASTSARDWQQRRRAAGRSFADHSRQHHSLLRRRGHRRHGHQQHAHRRQPHRVVWLGRRRTRLGSGRGQVPRARNLLFRRNVVRHIRHANAHLARQSATPTAASPATCSPTSCRSARPSTWR